ncbi:hypothetical protein KIH74_32155 [Kineosporia sp. J2-2]|uniref:Uncharacterized protein n=1 Tax=Kineosporia corallincola TaxID=2835133 RepID=A0ABS5TS77_9ACTN|nr:hypothetical protein [Kineosporia corallincola]MBT0773642.1 hypothetical protein [Kineosporia corallincola]
MPISSLLPAAGAWSRRHWLPVTLGSCVLAIVVAGWAVLFLGGEPGSGAAERPLGGALPWQRGPAAGGAQVAPDPSTGDDAQPSPPNGTVPTAPGSSGAGQPGTTAPTSGTATGAPAPPRPLPGQPVPPGRTGSPTTGPTSPGHPTTGPPPPGTPPPDLPTSGVPSHTGPPTTYPSTTTPPGHPTSTHPRTDPPNPPTTTQPPVGPPVTRTTGPVDDAIVVAGPGAEVYFPRDFSIFEVQAGGMLHCQGIGNTNLTTIDAISVTLEPLEAGEDFAYVDLPTGRVCEGKNLFPDEARMVGRCGTGPVPPGLPDDFSTVVTAYCHMSVRAPAPDGRNHRARITATAETLCTGREVKQCAQLPAESRPSPENPVRVRWQVYSAVLRACYAPGDTALGSQEGCVRESTTATPTAS